MAHGDIHKTEGNHANLTAVRVGERVDRERVNRVRYRTRDEARADLFDYIEMFYNPKRQHGSNGGLSPVEYEKQYKNETKKRLVN